MISLAPTLALDPADPTADYNAKRKALHDLEMNTVASNDPEIAKAIQQRKLDLDKEARAKGVTKGKEE